MATELAGELRSAVVRFARRLRRERPEYPDLSLSHLSALGCLDKAGPMSPRDLAAAERVQPPSMTRIVARLTDLGLVDRVPHPSDGRQAVLSITRDGRALVEDSRRRREAWLARRLDGLTDAERAVLRDAAEILDRLAAT